MLFFLIHAFHVSVLLHFNYNFGINKIHLVKHFIKSYQSTLLIMKKLVICLTKNMLVVTKDQTLYNSLYCF